MSTTYFSAIVLAVLLSVGGAADGTAAETIPKFGAVYRFHGEPNRHGIEVTLPAGAPSILSDFASNFGPSGVQRGFLGHRYLPEHNGIDIAAAEGAAILAAADGVVVRSHFSDLTGEEIFLDHGDHLYTWYLHLSARNVAVGETVSRGDVIGVIGRSGTWEGGVRQLHFGYLKDGPPANPHRYWYNGPGRVTCFDPDRTYDGGARKITYPVACEELE